VSPPERPDVVERAERDVLLRAAGDVPEPDFEALDFEAPDFDAPDFDPAAFVDRDREGLARELFAADADVDLLERPLFDDELRVLRERGPADDFELLLLADPARRVGDEPRRTETVRSSRRSLSSFWFTSTSTSSYSFAEASCLQRLSRIRRRETKGARAASPGRKDGSLSRSRPGAPRRRRGGARFRSS
jgi:hypothetical protein